MPADFAQIPDGARPDGEHVQQLIRSWLGLGEGVRMRLTEVNDPDNFALDLRNRGAGGKHQRIRHSSGSPTLFAVTDGGVLLSAAGEAAGHSLLRINMGVLWFGTAANVPAGWTIVGQNRFLYGANVDGDVSAIGGADTHSHTSPAHAHPIGHTHDDNHTHNFTYTHGHGATTGPSSTFDAGGPPGGPRIPTETHTHTVNSTSLSGTTGNSNDPTTGSPSVADSGATAITVDAANHLPSYLRCYFLKRTA